MNKISVIGSGSWGTAIAVMLANNSHDVTLWSYIDTESAALNVRRENTQFLPGIKIPESVKYTSSLADCAHADIIVCALPSAFVGQTMGQFRPYIRDGQIIVNLSKGIDSDRLLTMSALIKQELPTSNIVALSGPSHAEEVARKVPTTLVAGSDNLETAAYIQSVFMSPTLRVYTNPDILGVELGGSFKNVIALCSGIADGLGFGDNTKAALITRGLHEIIKLGTAMGAKAETFAGLSGMGDLIVTCTSMHSRNRRAGILLGQGKSLEQVRQEIKMVIEGIDACRAAKLLADKFSIEMPIISEAYAVIFENKPAIEAANKLMRRAGRSEVLNS